MGVRKLTADTLRFKCMGMVGDGHCGNVADIPMSEIRAKASSGSLSALVLPPCSSCGATSICIPGLDDTPQYHLIRMLWRRVVAIGKFFDDESESLAPTVSSVIGSFYAAAGRENEKDQFENNSFVLELASDSE